MMWSNNPSREGNKNTVSAYSTLSDHVRVERAVAMLRPERGEENRFYCVFR